MDMLGYQNKYTITEDPENVPAARLNGAHRRTDVTLIPAL